MTNANYSDEALVAAVRDTVAWFDLFDYPLTSRELERYLPLTVTGKRLEQLLPTLDFLNVQHGLWFLVGRQDVLLERQRRVNYSDRKLKKASRFARVFAFLPWLQLVAVVNQIGSHNLHDDGDIDLLVVCSPRRLWLSRLLMAGCLKIFDLRPRPNHSRDTYCLSFLVANDHLDLAPFRQSDEDLYFTYWLAGLEPIWSRPGVLEQLWAANAWLPAALPNWQAPVSTRRLHLAATSGRSSTAWLDQLETRLHTWQYKRLPSKLKTLANHDSRVVLTESVIKLHVNDRRQQFLAAWQQRLKNL